MDRELRGRLAAVVGNAAIEEGNIVHPANLTQLRELMALADDRGVRVLPAAHSDPWPDVVILSSDRLDSVRLDASTLLVHAGASATWTAVRQELGVAGLGVCAAGGMRQSTIGDSVASGEVPRRAVAGVDLLTRRGELISAGGRTLKDVVGYDLSGLALGSGTALGAIVGVTLRLEPAGAGTPAEAGPGPWRGDAGIDLAAAFGS